jgi:hypothetical protein
MMTTKYLVVFPLFRPTLTPWLTGLIFLLGLLGWSSFVQAKSESGLQEKRPVLSIHRPETRMTVALFLLDCQSANRECPSQAGLGERLLKRLVSSGRFNMVERQRIEEVLREQKLSASGLVRKSQALRIGQLLNVSGLLTGELREVGEELQVSIKLVESNTSTILATVTEYSSRRDRVGVTNLAESLVDKLVTQMPLIEGRITHIRKDGRITLNFGHTDGVRAGMLVLIYTVGDPILHPRTGKHLSNRVQIHAKARIEEIQPDHCFAYLLNREKYNAIKKLQSVIIH